MYYCPKCGGSFDASACIEQGELLRCPECPTIRVKLRGSFLVALGLLILFVCTQIMVPYVPTMGILIGGGLCTTGIIRSIRHRQARRKNQQNQEESGIEEHDDPE